MKNLLIFYFLFYFNIRKKSIIIVIEFKSYINSKFQKTKFIILLSIYNTNTINVEKKKIIFILSIIAFQNSLKSISRIQFSRKLKINFAKHTKYSKSFIFSLNCLKTMFFIYFQKFIIFYKFLINFISFFTITHNFNLYIF